ncbi:MAG: PorT family protein [Bacteroidales bacterium]|nr:PorT family protein [Bacteroidales bacterium]MCF8388365.1 PorT family protein [Bacteroidales bacterium]MCF8397272.1 PorT family protein [Bacteroidales bacterium]
MIKKHLLSFTLIFFTLFASAQEFEGGVHLGICASQVQGDNFSGYNKAGLYAGAYVAYQFSKHSVAKLELDYIQKGSREIPDENEIVTYKLNIHYAEMPLLYEYIINDRFSVEAGLALGVFIAKKEEYDYIPQVRDEDFNRFTLSGIVGLYYHFNETWRVNIRTNNSILPIRPHTNNIDLPHRLFDEGQYSDLLSIGLQVTL